MKIVKTALLATLLVGSLVGCAKQKAYSPVAVTPDPARVDDVVPPGEEVQPQYATNTVALDDVSTASLRQFFFKNPPNNPTNVRLYVNVANDGKGYAGEIKVQFDDNGVTRQAVLSSQHPYTGVSDASLNQWFNWNGKQSFHGIYQDSAGAVVVVIDSTISLGDGSGSSILGGSIWFQNFGYTGAAQGPQKMCWEIQIGPYDCRTFIEGNTRYDKAVVNTYSSLYPTTSTTGGDATTTGSAGNRPAYVKIGSFAGLLRASAFNE